MSRVSDYNGRIRIHCLGVTHLFELGADKRDIEVEAMIPAQSAGCQTGQRSWL